MKKGDEIVRSSGLSERFRKRGMKLKEVEMKLFRLLIICAFAIVVVSQTSVIADEPAEEQSQGEKLVRQLWSDMKQGNVEAIKEYIAEGFQSIHEDGARDRDAETKLIEGLNLGNYTLSEFKVTQTGSVIVVTYFVSVEETIDGKIQSTKPAARLSAWVEIDDEWKWIVHANLEALK